MKNVKKTQKNAMIGIAVALFIVYWAWGIADAAYRVRSGQEEVKYYPHGDATYIAFMLREDVIEIARSMQKTSFEAILEYLRPKFIAPQKRLPLVSRNADDKITAALGLLIYDEERANRNRQEDTITEYTKLRQYVMALAIRGEMVKRNGQIEFVEATIDIPQLAAHFHLCNGNIPDVYRYTLTGILSSTALMDSFVRDVAWLSGSDRARDTRRQIENGELSVESILTAEDLELLEALLSEHGENPLGAEPTRF